MMLLGHGILAFACLNIKKIKKIKSFAL